MLAGVQCENCGSDGRVEKVCKHEVTYFRYTQGHYEEVCVVCEELIDEDSE
jgi:hypothetical protein